MVDKTVVSKYGIEV